VSLYQLKLEYITKLIATTKSINNILLFKFIEIYIINVEVK